MSEVEEMAAELEWQVLWAHGSDVGVDAVDWQWIAKELHAKGWRLPAPSCRREEHILYESCGICGDIPGEVAEQCQREEKTGPSAAAKESGQEEGST